MTNPAAPPSQPYQGGAVPPSYGPGGAVPPQYGPDGAAQPPYSAGATPEAFGSAPQGFGSAPEKKKSFGKKAIGIVGLILVFILISFAKGAVKSYFRSDPTADAKVGQCINTDKVTSDKEQETDAKMAKCGSPEATFSIVGRVEKETDLNSTSCDKYFTEEKAEYAIVNSVIGDGYLLCLKKV